MARRRTPQATIGEALFLFGGLVSGIGAAVPHARAQETDPVALGALALSCALVGVVLLALPSRLTRWVPEIGVVAAVAVVSYGLTINGEADGGPPLFSEMFFIWPVLYVGYYLRPWKIAATLVLIGAAYLAALAQLGQPAADCLPRYLIAMASFAGIAVALRFLRITVDQLLARLKETARTDPLTGLLNRRAFDEQLQAEVARSIRTADPFVLVLGDVDHFKRINDRDGHAAGDDALQRVAQLLGETARRVDTVARIGGEEFALILPGTDRAGGVEAAERIRLALRDAALTMSFGVVEGPRDGTVADLLLREADRALYAAKAAGRDRTETGAAAPVGATAP